MTLKLKGVKCILATHKKQTTTQVLNTQIYQTTKIAHLGELIFIVLLGKKNKLRKSTVILYRKSKVKKKKKLHFQMFMDIHSIIFGNYICKMYMDILSVIYSKKLNQIQ